MTGLDSLYRKEDGHVLIEIKLSSVAQLFNSFDPAPFYQKELDREAAEYIVDTVRDFPASTEFRIVVHLPPEAAKSAEAQKIPRAIANHFRYMALYQERKFREKSVYGKYTILIGLTFLAVAEIASRVVAETFSESPVAQLAATALNVAGWVAMWEPVTVHLYQLWPIVKTRKIYEKISRMETVVVPAV